MANGKPSGSRNIKPGTVIKGYIWTGKRWLKNPERTADKVRVQKEIDANSKTSTRVNVFNWGAGEQSSGKGSPVAGGKYPGGQYKPMLNKKNTTGAKATKSDASRTKGYVPMTKRTEKSAAKPDAKPLKEQKKTTTPSSGNSIKRNKENAVSKRPAVSQSRTMWVEKGTMVGGKEVKKGYLAQYGKPEKRVTAPVKLVQDTKRGKAGETVDYKKGRYKKKSGK